MSYLSNVAQKRRLDLLFVFLLTAIFCCCSAAPTRLILVRHTGRADYADESWIKTAHNSLDPPIAHGGKILARKLGDHLNRRGVSLVYSSPFIRCLQTAQAACDVLDHIYDIYPEPGLAEFLHEVMFPWEHGEESIWAPFDFSKDICEFLQDKAWPIAHPSHPETLKQFYARCEETVTEIAKRCEGKTGLLVTHATVVEACIKTLVPNTQVPEIPIGSVTELVRESRTDPWRVVELADCAYVKTAEAVIDFDL